MKTSVGVTLLLAIAASPVVLADDGAASIAAGGLVMKREVRITMAKEVLFISTEKVIVDYDFRNETDTDTTTEVAFPIPRYSEMSVDELSPTFAGFDNFKLWIEGKPATFEVETKAILHGKDYSGLLKSFHINIANFGYSNSNDHRSQIEKLSTTQKARLMRAGLIDGATSHDALWSVDKKFYWSQTFPAHKTIHIRHEYAPVVGNSNNIYWFDKSTDAQNDAIEGAGSFCADASLLNILKPFQERHHRPLPLNYVDFILTTANTWKRPIEDFTLIVERPHEKSALQSFVSFCWDGPVTKLDDDHFSAHALNLTPTKELHIGFVSVSSWSFN
jgi:hypothetical protein